MRVLSFVISAFGIVTAHSAWHATEVPGARQPVLLRILLKQQYMDEAIDRLLQISTPGSGCYGQYLSQSQISALTAPSNKSKQAVLSWLQGAGVTVDDRYLNGRLLTFTTTTDIANELLQADFKYFTHVDGTRRLRTRSYTVHENVSQYIDLVTPTTYFGKSDTARYASSATPELLLSRDISFGCAKAMTPDCIRQQLNIPIDYMPNATSGSKIGFGSFLNESSRYEDLFLFEQEYKIQSQNVTKVNINNATDNQSDSTSNAVEANLDVQNLMGIAHPLPIYEYLTQGSPPIIPNLDLSADDNTNEPYLDYFNYLLTLPDSSLPQVVSQSYGDDEQTVPLDYAISVCNLAALLGLCGVSVLESSGDTGVGAPCMSNNPSGENKPKFTPDFPSTCPWITSVGGTSSLFSSAWSHSSGGFSSYFPTPAYQNATINTYLASLSPSKRAFYATYTNLSGRAFPDIAAHSADPGYAIYLNGELTSVGGTSGAAPVVAGVVGMLNAARLDLGLPTLGFLNPWLYSCLLYTSPSPRD